MIRLHAAYALIALHSILITPASALHMAEFILTNRHIRNVEFDNNATLWFEKFDDRCNSSFIIPGWRNSARERDFEVMADSYNLIENECFNTVRVNWPDAMGGYVAALKAVRMVAEEVAMFIRRMQRKGLVKNVELVGFSLGAHMAGLTGRMLTEYLGSNDLITEIVALDPAGPGYTDVFMVHHQDRLLHTDAQNVVVLHTNLGCAGTSKRLAAVNFIANNGRDQIGCASLDCICSHHRAIEYFIESLTSQSFIGWSETDLMATFGRGRNQFTEPGDYYFKTNAVSPYARGA